MNQIFFENEEGQDILSASAAEETEAVVVAPAPETEAKVMPLADAGITAALGYGVVFSGLFLLLAVISIMGAVFKASARKKAAKAAAEPVPEVPELPAKLAPGTAGELKLFDVPDKEAAMIMAIVADKLQKPLNELRFISIKEVK
ncbi:MAG: OadG family protein [Clostridia bacterium]|nr:OadG family protein [Clostridia bacterium]